jgi:hypothetical protein
MSIPLQGAARGRDGKQRQSGMLRFNASHSALRCNKRTAIAWNGPIKPTLRKSKKYAMFREWPTSVLYLIVQLAQFMGLVTEEAAASHIISSAAKSISDKAAPPGNPNPNWP